MDQRAKVVALVGEVLADAVLGVYLHGSSVLGRLRPTSDIDVLVVTARRTLARERDELIERLLPLSGPGDPTGRSRSVDLAIVAQGDVRPWAYPGRLDLQFGDWFRPDYARGDLAPWDPTDPDLAVTLAMVVQVGRPLTGPEPSELVDRIPWEDVRRAMVDSIPGLLGDLDGDERNVVLTFARIWATLATGRFMSKDGAAAWAARRLPAEDRAVVERAGELYRRGVAEEAWGDLVPAIRPCIRHMTGEIDAAAAHSAPEA